MFDELADAEIYFTRPTRDDPADSRSDHSSFQRNGFPATMVSENFFGGTVARPADEPNNPQYHRWTDRASTRCMRRRSVAQPRGRHGP